MRTLTIGSLLVLLVGCADLEEMGRRVSGKPLPPPEMSAAEASRVEGECKVSAMQAYTQIMAAPQTKVEQTVNVYPENNPYLDPALMRQIASSNDARERERVAKDARSWAYQACLQSNGYRYGEH